MDASRPECETACGIFILKRVLRFYTVILNSFYADPDPGGAN
jgi:hypothetical protein